MSRTTPEWIGKTDDTPLPPRVKLRIFEKYNGRCAKSGVKLHAGSFDFDHIIALCNGGENRENNFQPLLRAVHKEKTKLDVASKAKDARIKKKFLGLKPKAEKDRYYRGVGGRVMDRETGKPKV